MYEAWGQTMRVTMRVRHEPGFYKGERCRITAPISGNLYDNFAAPVRRAFEHLMCLTTLIEPQHFAHFGP